MMQSTQPYNVEWDSDGCSFCSAGRTYTIVGPDGVGVEQAWHSEDAAEDVAEHMNDAFASGRKASAAPELLDALKDALEWIDAVPAETILPSMPGFDRDGVDDLIAKAEGRQ